MQYTCRYVNEVRLGIPWKQMDEVSLRDVTSGKTPRLATRVRACWTKDSLYIRFECEDDHVVATMECHDDPLYLEDVVEVFIDEAGTGQIYYEIEVSPRNVVFDALIDRDAGGGITADMDWHAEGLQTKVCVEPDGARVYELRLPLRIFKQLPVNGTSWRWNLFRIDDDAAGERHYSAWCPTGAVNFHVPERFGTLVFEKSDCSTQEGEDECG
ncbi:carbohydrate-binding family 9-like protein [Paenibacillus solisilvae]|uniref:Carbohydrate-binding family 9-like protein n=1 Tax=Paenibacillus solisilvae TaxID=2486751 RepID=A0ABW0W2J6_9BACL